LKCVLTESTQIGIKPRDELAVSAGINTAPRGGFIVDQNLETNVPGIYAVGECASWHDQTFGLIAPGVEMADVLAFNICQSAQFGGDQPPRAFRRPDLSTKLKLLGVNVASFGDYFADRDGPQDATEGQVGIKALSYKDPFEAVYKKYLFTADGKRLIGGMIIGDTNDYIKLVGMVKSKKLLDVPPSRFILGAKKEGEDDNPDDL
jgi:nitrite reductase (NAD(P)H)